MQSNSFTKSIPVERASWWLRDREKSPFSGMAWTSGLLPVTIKELPWPVTVCSRVRGFSTAQSTKETGSHPWVLWVGVWEEREVWILPESFLTKKSISSESPLKVPSQDLHRSAQTGKLLSHTRQCHSRHFRVHMVPATLRVSSWVKHKTVLTSL